MPESIMTLTAYNWFAIIPMFISWYFTVKRAFPFPLHHPSYLFNNFLGPEETYESHSYKQKGCDQNIGWNNNVR